MGQRGSPRLGDVIRFHVLGMHQLQICGCLLESKNEIIQDNYILVITWKFMCILT